MKANVFALLVIICAYSFGQEVAVVEKKSFVDDEGNLFWNKEKPIYLRISDTPDGEGQLLKSKKSEPYTNPMYLDTEGVNYIRTRYAVDPETKKPLNPPREILFEIYADSEAPQSSLILNANNKFKSNSKTYFGKGFTANLGAKDELSGVANSYLALNNNAFKTDNNSTTINSSGEYSISYYSTDNVGNVEKIQSKEFIIDVDNPITYYNINGFNEDKIIGTAAKIYLTFEDALSGVAKTYYKFDEEKFKTYGGKEIPFKYLEDGYHTLHFYSEDRVGNQEKVQQLEFYFDKSAPIVAADVLGDRFIANDQVYFSGRTKLKLTAVDNKSGVKDVLYSVDGEEFKSYSDPFYLPSVSGVHVIKYYSLDNMNNESEGKNNTRFEEFKHNVNKVYVDLTGPSIFHKFLGSSFTVRDTLFISPRTKINLSGTDKESGLQYLSYSIDGKVDETRYEIPFTVTQTGIHRVELFGYDNVNNRNIEAFEVVVDGTAPEIIANFSAKPTRVENGKSVYPTFVILYLAATDKEIGTDKIHYQLNGGTKKAYNVQIEGFKKGENKVKVFSVDKLGNESTKTITFIVE